MRSERAELFAQRAFAAAGAGLTLVAVLLGGIVLSNLERAPLGPAAFVLWMVASAAAHLFVASPDASRRAQWLALATESPILAGLAWAQWPMRAEEWVFLGIVTSVPVMISVALIVADRG